jgi:hypothetical protein
MLTATQIQELASRKGVRRTAVENFLTTLGNEGAAGERGARLNLAQDARDYGWNAATQSAIQRGINLYFKR